MTIRGRQEPTISRKNARNKKTRSPGFEPNNHWNICDRCDCSIRAKDSRLTWDGLVVCPDDWDYRHPQDFVRGRADDTSPVGLSRPEAATSPADRDPETSYTAQDRPTITLITSTDRPNNPFSYEAAGGATLTITGSGFTAGSTLTIGSATNLTPTIVSDTQMTLIAPPLPPNDAYAVVLLASSGEQAFSQLSVIP